MSPYTRLFESFYIIFGMGLVYNVLDHMICTLFGNIIQQHHEKHMAKRKLLDDHIKNNEVIFSNLYCFRIRNKLKNY